MGPRQSGRATDVARDQKSLTDLRTPRQYSCSEAAVLIVAFCSLNSVDFKFILQLWLYMFPIHIENAHLEKDTYLKETGGLAPGS